jgi:hypothetical protein
LTAVHACGAATRLVPVSFRRTSRQANAAIVLAASAAATGRSKNGRMRPSD